MVWFWRKAVSAGQGAPPGKGGLADLSVQGAWGGGLVSHFTFLLLPKCAVSSLGEADVFWKEHWVTWTPAPTPLWFPRALFSSSLFLDRLGLFLQAHHIPFLQKPHCR